MACGPRSALSSVLVRAPGHAWSAPACHLPYVQHAVLSSIIACMHASIFAPCAPFHIRAQRANEAAAALRTQQHAARQQQHSAPACTLVCTRACTGLVCACARTGLGSSSARQKPACTHAATAAAAAIATHCKGLRPYHPTGPHATTLCICALRIGSGAGCDRGVARDGVLGRQRLRDPRRLAVLHRR